MQIQTEELNPSAKSSSNTELALSIYEPTPDIIPTKDLFVKIYPEPSETERDYSKSVLNILKKDNVGPALHSVYRAVTNPKHGFTLGDDNRLGKFYFSPANNILEGEDVYGGKFIDIAWRYRGMGHVIVLAYIPKTNNFFFRNDGGSNDYDRADHFKTYSDSKFQPNKFKLYEKHVYSTEEGRIEYDLIHENLQYTYEDVMRAISNNKWVF